MGLLPLALLMAAVGTVGLGTTLVRRSAPSRETAVAAARTHATAATVAAVLLGGAAAVYAGATGLGNHSPGGLGVTALLVPITYGVVHTLVLALGELTWPRPHGTVRRARLVHRGLLDAAPRWLVRAGRVAGTLALLVLAGGALLADDEGRRFVATGQDGTIVAESSPFPGLFYGIPAGAGLVVLAITTTTTLWIVANRPAVATEDERIEIALRRASAHRVLRTAVGVTLVVSGGLLFVGGRALHSVATSGVASSAVDVLGGAASLIGAAALLGGVVVGCVRAPGVPADAPAVPAG